MSDWASDERENRAGDLSLLFVSPPSRVNITFENIFCVVRRPLVAEQFFTDAGVRLLIC
jgi:hypothetical protein